VRGAGAMGVVYRGRDRRLGRDVAIKLLKTGTPGTDHCGKLCALLVREAQTLARISHPNVIGIHDVGDFRGCVYVAMEFIDGETLSTWSAKSGRTWTERLDVLLAAGAGLAAAHGGHIVHRDFKPDNVIVGGAGEVKVTDFGVARAPIDVDPPADIGCGCAASSDASCAIDPGAIVGTPMYMAPEVMSGTPADTRSDQFSFAASAWEVFYGNRPFAGDDILTLYGARFRDEISAPPAVHDVPAKIAEVLARALRASPSRRHPSIEKMLEEVRLAVA
jgi:eukaryotic-like serine/threonine-protein kinase